MKHTSFLPSSMWSLNKEENTLSQDCTSRGGGNSSPPGATFSSSPGLFSNNFFHLKGGFNDPPFIFIIGSLVRLVFLLFFVFFFVRFVRYSLNIDSFFLGMVREVSGPPQELNRAQIYRVFRSRSSFFRFIFIFFFVIFFNSDSNLSRKSQDQWGGSFELPNYVFYCFH